MVGAGHSVAQIFRLFVSRQVRNSTYNRTTRPGYVKLLAMRREGRLVLHMEE